MGSLLCGMGNTKLISLPKVTLSLASFPQPADPQLLYPLPLLVQKADPPPQALPTVTPLQILPVMLPTLLLLMSPHYSMTCLRTLVKTTIFWKLWMRSPQKLYRL